MKLPAPRERLGDCIWLARIIAKARLIDSGELPQEYAVRFCHPTGVDGAFTGFFGLTREEIVAAAKLSDEKVVAWFQDRPAGCPEAIAQWNEIAVNLGRTNFPMAERLLIAKTTTYKHLDTTGLETVFEVIELDER